MIKPYYNEDGITIYNADCRDVLGQLEPVDLVLTDPPYGLNWKEMKFDQKSKVDWQDAKKWDVRPENSLLELIKQKGDEWVIWGGNYMAGILGDCKSPLVWDKQTGANNFADGEMAFTSFRSGTLRIFRHQWCGAFKDSERGVKNYHPTQKPVALMKWCIQQAGNVKSVADFYMGSGTTLVAAKALGLKAIGIEISKDYCDIAIERLRQRSLFASLPAPELEVAA